MIHVAHLEGSDDTGFIVRCSCGWISESMGLGAAFFTQQHVLTDRGHAQYALT